jgi:uncharacterized cupin superfamily protein
MRKVVPRAPSLVQLSRMPAVAARTAPGGLDECKPLGHTGADPRSLEPGAWSSQRHYHHREDEFVYVLEGEVVLVGDDGEEVLRAGDSVGFVAGVPDAHHFQNRSTSHAVLLEVGTHDENEIAEYPDIDLRMTPSGYVHRDGTPYER